MTAAGPALQRIALAALADALPPGTPGAEAQWLQGLATHWASAGLQDASALHLAAWRAAPPPSDAGLCELMSAFGLSEAEVVMVALALAVEFDPMAGRALAWLQAPVGGARPTLGLLASLAPAFRWAAGGEAAERVMSQVYGGRARTCGLLVELEPRPLSELALQIPLPLALALHATYGAAADPDPDLDQVSSAMALGLAPARSPQAAALWPGMYRLQPPATLAPSLQAAVRQQASALAAEGGVLLLRSGHAQEAREAAAAVAAALGRGAVGFEGAPPTGAGPWLRLQRALPVLLADLAPGESLRLPRIPGYDGPVLVATGLEGQVEEGKHAVAQWIVPLPLPDERALMWGDGLPEAAAQRLGHEYRHSASQINRLCQAARRLAALEAAAGVHPGAADVLPLLLERHVHQARRQSGAGGLGTLAQWLSEDVPDDAMVAGPALREALDALHRRCLRRDGLADALGPAARTRYRPGVRALLVGPSGTGKTLAAGWLAHRLGLPLYRVDVASVSSKYIGETEKNLAQVFARAEHAGGVLLFDEADSLFGKRTEIKDSNDRFANQQTNYLLQRIESFDGITLLTSNSRSRFDSAFTRRLDAIIDFPAPGADERRTLWLAHLGLHHSLAAGDVNRVAAVCDLSGGHIRNATLAAASLAPGAVGYAALRSAIEAEYRKLGRPVPAGL